MRKYQGKGIVLSRSFFGESDMYVQFLTKEWGVISALARAARKSKRRYVGGLDLFCHDELLLRGDPRERPYLIELSVLNSFEGLRSHLDRMLAAGKITQWVRKLVLTATPMPRLYSLLGQTLALIEQEEDPERVETLSLVFRMKLLAQLGLMPQLLSCVRCESLVQFPAVFDVAAGGASCQACQKPTEENYSLQKEDQVLMEHAERTRFAAWEETQLPTRRLRPVLSLITQFASFHGHTRLPV
ncbi:MAG: DNA repair protein RecO [Bdellovibrionales bacterium]|nr:DNA repair protein RecO [Bdellovibrionales bacterium]